MKFRVVDLSYDLAKDLLKKNHVNNRRPRGNRIDLYASDMAAGLWKLTHQPIAVDIFDKLVDGQQRCFARVEAEELADKRFEVPVVLATGVPAASMVGVDCGANRNIADASRVLGRPLPHNENTYSAVARRMYGGMKQPLRVSIQVMLSFMRAHKDALEFSFQCLCRQQRAITPSALRAVLARAYYRRQSRSRIREFAEIIRTGLVNNRETDEAAINFRNWLYDQLRTVKTSAHAGRNPTYVYAMAETALQQFLNLEKPSTKILKPTKEELFPIVGGLVD